MPGEHRRLINLVIKPIFDHLIRSGYSLVLNEYGIINNSCDEWPDSRHLAIYINYNNIHLVAHGIESIMSINDPALIPAIEEHFKGQKA